MVRANKGVRLLQLGLGSEIRPEHPSLGVKKRIRLLILKGNRSHCIIYYVSTQACGM